MKLACEKRRARDGRVGTRRPCGPQRHRVRLSGRVEPSCTSWARFWTRECTCGRGVATSSWGQAAVDRRQGSRSATCTSVCCSDATRTRRWQRCIKLLGVNGARFVRVHVTSTWWGSGGRHGRPAWTAWLSVHSSLAIRRSYVGAHLTPSCVRRGAASSPAFCPLRRVVALQCRRALGVV